MDVDGVHYLAENDLDHLFYFNQSQDVSVEELGSLASGDDLVGWDGSLGIVRCCDLQFQSDPAYKK